MIVTFSMLLTPSYLTITLHRATLAQMESQRKRRPPPLPATESRFSSVRTIKSVSRSSPTGSNRSDSPDEDGHTEESRISRALSLRKTNSSGHARSQSRPQSRASRKRADSIATSAHASEKEVDGDKDKEREREKKRRSVAGWASSKMSSLAHRGKKDKSRSKSESLMADRDDVGSDDEDGDDRYDYAPRPTSAHSSSLRSSRHSTPTIASSVPKTLQASLRKGDKKMVIALHDFAAGSSDELTFRAGDKIVVLNEVLDDWWMGELDGKTGLFPSTYAEVLKDAPPKLPLPRRPSPTSNVPPSSLPSGDNASRQPRWLASTNTGNFSIQSDDDDHPFGDSYITGPLRAPEGTFYDAQSITSSVDDYDDNKRLVAPRAGDENRNGNGVVYDYDTIPSNTAAPPIPIRNATAKKPPPPPPPRRSTFSSVPPPPLPNRPPMSRSNTSSQSNSTASSYVTVTTATPPDFNSKLAEIALSPFDSPKDSAFGVAQGCDNFKQNPFKAPGVCANCFLMHT